MERPEVNAIESGADMRLGVALRVVEDVASETDHLTQRRLRNRRRIGRREARGAGVIVPGCADQDG